MKAIVVVLLRIREAHTSEEQLPRPQSRTLLAPASPSDRTWTPPLWTWFVENPRLVQHPDIAV
jgi:hypothetical protein